MESGSYNSQTLSSKTSDVRPVEAISLTRHLNTGGKKTQLTSEIASIWAEEDPETALAWISNNQEFREGRSQLLSSVVTGQLRRDGNAALDWILDLEELSGVCNRTVSTILKNLANQDPELALQRALEQPIEENGAGLEHTVVIHIAKSDLQLAKSIAMRNVRCKGIARQFERYFGFQNSISSCCNVIARDDLRDILTDDQIEYVRKNATGNSIQSTVQLI